MADSFVVVERELKEGEYTEGTILAEKYSTYKEAKKAAKALQRKSPELRFDVLKMYIQLGNTVRKAPFI